MLFQNCARSKLKDFVVVTIFETFHAVGVGLFIFVVLPDLDVVKGAMICNCVALGPGMFGMFK